MLPPEQFKVRSSNSTLLLLQYKLKFLELRFYLHAIKWLISHEVPKNPNARDIYDLFYLGFLSMDEQYIEIVELTDDKLVTRCTNPCPILEIAEDINISTREVCLKTSERGCKFYLRLVSKNIEFIRNYENIRPIGRYCEETILIHGK